MTVASLAWRNAAVVALAGLIAALLMSSALPAERGLASWYQSGHHTANGERFRPDGMTCAHRTLRFGTMLKVTHMQSGRWAVCRVNDRGPARWTHRFLDVSRGVARKLGMLRQGVAIVRIQIIH